MPKHRRGSAIAKRDQAHRLRVQVDSVQPEGTRPPWDESSTVSKESTLTIPGDNHSPGPLPSLPNSARSVPSSANHDTRL